MKLLEMLHLLLIVPLLVRRFQSRAAGFPPPSSLKMAVPSSFRREQRDDVVPQGWLLAHDELRVLYGCTPDGQWLKFSYYGDDLGLLYHTEAGQALEAVRAGFWVIVGTEDQALAAGRELAMEQFEYLLLELLA
jgi:hypothetical protein